MALYLIGAGLYSEKDITIRGLELLKRSDEILLEGYTSVSSIDLKKLEQMCGRKVRLVDRDLMEQGSSEILKNARNKNVSILIVGDPLSATTHFSLIEEAELNGIKTEIVHNASVITAVGITGLQLYKFGKITSIPFPSEKYEIETPYEVLAENLSIRAHTLMLLDLNPQQKKFLTANQAIEYMLNLEEKKGKGIFRRETKIVVCARLGSPDFTVRYGRADSLISEDFGSPPHCIIVPSQLHFTEEENLKKWEI